MFLVVLIVVVMVVDIVAKFFVLFVVGGGCNDSSAAGMVFSLMLRVVFMLAGRSENAVDRNSVGVHGLLLLLLVDC